MDLHSTASLTDEALNDLYHRRRNYGGPRNANNGKKSVKTMRLAPLGQSKSSHSLTRNPSDLSSPSLDSKASKDQNRSPLLLAKNHHSPSRDKKGSNTEDIHYLSHLKHKAAGLSGLSPYKSPDQVNGKVIDEEIKLNEDEEEEEEVEEDSHPLPPFQLHQKAQENHQQLNQRVEEMQYQLLQESNYLSSLMASVVQQYESLKALNQSIIVHRREIATKVNDINENYIQLFENMLQEVMKIQRIKFKSQTKLLEDYRIENERVVQTYTIVIQNNERLQEEYAKLEQEKADVDNFNVSLLQQHEEIKRQNQALQLTNNALVVQNRQLHKLTDEVALLHSYKQKLKETEALLARKEDLIVSLTAKYQKELAEKNEMIAKYSEEVNYLKEINSKNSIFNNLDKLTFQYPRAESSTQTEVTEDGLWDTSQGWVLPISKTALARQRWRRAGSFARCPSCRGIGKYIISVQSLLKKCIYGLNSSIDMLTGEHKVIMVNSDRYLKWRIPDELVIFLNNLPITIQAKKPKSLLWTIQHLYMILHYKFISDEEDNRLQYVTQSFFEFIIEQLLRNTEHRYQAEVQMYELLISIKEYSIHHPLVTLVARCLSLVDGLVEEEKDAYFMELKKNEEALQRKKKKEFERLSARERNKLLSEWKDQQQQHPAAKNNTCKKSASYFQHIINKQQANSKNDGNPAHQIVEREFEVTDFSLSKDILKIVLFTRYCCLAQPYEGVYCRQLAEVHREIHQGKYSNHPTIKKVIEYEKRLKKLSQTFWKSKDGNADLDGGASVSRSYDFTDSYQSSTHQGKAKKEQKEVEDPFALPKHVICDVESGHYHHYVPLDRAIRVLHPFLAQLKAHQIISIFRVIEDHTKCLFPDGSVYLPSGLNTFIRSTLRLFLYALSDNGEDIPSWEMVRELYHHPSDAESFHLLQEYSIDPTSFQSESHPSQISHPQAVPGGKKKKAKKGEKQALPSSLPSINEESSKAFDSVNKVGEDEMISSPVAEGAASFDRVQLHEDLQKYILMTDLDFFLTIIAELIRYQLLSIEDRLRQIFDEGDVNHDNVLSFDEFKAIVCHVKPDFPDRTILKMFREALTQGPENKDCIGPDSFVNICKEYQLFDILDIEELKTKQLQALWKGKPGEEITEEPLSVYIDVNDAIEPIDPTATIESVMIPIPAVTPTPPPLKSKSKIPISQINNTIDSLLKEKTISQQTTSQMKKDTTSIPPTNMSEKEGVASKQQVSVPPPTLKTMEGMMISSAKLNEPLSKESSQKMMSILNQRKEQRLKEKGYQLGVFSEG